MILEVFVRFLSTENVAHVELFMNKKHRYLLPLPTDSNSFHPGAAEKGNTDSYRVYDDTLGWSHRAWGQDDKDFVCFANNRGMRISEEKYRKKAKAKKHYKILTIGDSFTHGDAVSCEDSWPYILEQKSGISVGNLGVGGYGIQQALLRLMYSGITADTVLFGVIWGDFERAIDPVYTFYQGGNKTKPMIKFDGDAHSLVNVPVLKPEEFYFKKKKHKDPIFALIPDFNANVFSNTLWTKSYFLRLLVSINHQKKHFKETPVYLTKGENLEYCVKIFELFNQYCNENGMYGKIVFLDTRLNFVHKEKWNLENPWSLVEEMLTGGSIPFVDFHEELYSTFQKSRDNLIHSKEKLHYSPKGNNLVAHLLMKDLEIIEDKN